MRGSVLDVETERLLRAHTAIGMAFNYLRPTERLMELCYAALCLVHR